jgi:hypothetical protein
MADPLDPAILPKILERYVTWAKVQSAVQAILPPEIQHDDRRNYVARLAPDDLNDTSKQYRALVEKLVQDNRLQAFQLELFNQGQGNLVLRGILQRRISVNDDGDVDQAAVQSLRNVTEPFLNSETFFAGMEAARYRVCALWIDDKVTPTGIKGTGFLFAPDLVLTARHVIEALLEQGPAEIVNGEIVAPTVAKAGSHSQLALVFDYWTQASHFRLDAVPAGVRIVRPVEKWLEWSSDRHPGDGVTHVFGQPDISHCLDAAVIRLSDRIGAAVAGSSGSRMRGWMHLNGAGPRLVDGNAIAILQHPSGGPQVFDKGNYKQEDPSHTRIWYETETAGGSSGSPCFDSDPAVVGFHNAGWPTQYQGTTARYNQGIRIDHVVAAMPKPLVDESRQGWSKDTALWTLSENAEQLEPVLGRGTFKQAVLDLFDLRSKQRVIIVEHADDQLKEVGKSGKSFSTRILQAIARGRPGFVVEFNAKDIRGMSPEHFLTRLGKGLGLADFGEFPQRPTDEQQPSRYWSFDLPERFATILEERAKAAGTAALDVGVDPAIGSATGRELLLRELLWIVIDDLHLAPLEGGIKELVAGLIGVTDSASVRRPGLKSLRFLLIGHTPDFVRGRTDYRHDEVSQLNAGLDEWMECLTTAALSRGKADTFNPEAAAALFTFQLDLLKTMNNPELSFEDPERRLYSLSKVVPMAIRSLKLL